MLLVRFSAGILIFLSVSCGIFTEETQQKSSSPASIAEQDTSTTIPLSSPLRSLSLTRLSPYDDIIKKYSRRFGFDWRLIAAQIFAESHFRSDAKSRTGALGLMQIMPSTAQHLGINPKLLLKPEHNIGLGCLYDRKLFNRWSDHEGTNRLAFTLASYNAGRTRVLRAFLRANRPNRWEKVKPYLPGETRIYVVKIFNMYQEYKRSVF